MVWQAPGMGVVRRCRSDEQAKVLAIVNAAAQAYRGVIPADRWHDPYMPPEELERRHRRRRDFWGYEADGELPG